MVLSAVAFVALHAWEMLVLGLSGGRIMCKFSTTVMNHLDRLPDGIVTFGDLATALARQRSAPAS